MLTQYPQANNGILVSDDTAFDTTNTENDSEINKKAEERQLHRMSEVQTIVTMWQGSQNLRATQKECHASIELITAVGYIFDTEEIFKAFWSLLQPDGAAACKLSEWLPLPPAVSANDLSGGQTQINNVR